MTTQIYQSYSFIPANISGCYVWLDASTRSNFTFSSGSNISTWIDRSGNGYSATATNSPIHDATNQRVQFTSASSQYMLNLSAPLNLTQRSFFFVIQEITNTNVCGIMPIIPNPTSGTDYLSASGLTIEATGGVYFFANSGFYADRITSSVPLAKAIYSEVYANPNGIVYLNGLQNNSATASYTPTTSSGYGLGTRWISGAVSTPYFNGYMYEIISYSKALSTSERQQVEGYLAWKWSLVASLPNTHPYKKFPPFTNLYRLPVTITTPISDFNNPVFTPTQISGCVVWFDAADRSTLNFAGTAITRWTSKGTSSLVATSVGAGGITYQPYNGKNCLKFNGQNTKMTTGSITSYGASATTWITASVNLVQVTASTPTDASLVIASDTNSVEKSIRYSTSANAQIYTFNPNLASIRYSNNSSNGIRGFIDTSPSFTAYVNGSDATILTAPVTYTAVSNPTFIMGQWASGTLDGYIQEIIIYNSALTLAQYQQVEGYLAWKWGFQSSLPSTHPYAKSPYPSLSYAPVPIYPPIITSGIWNPTTVSGVQLWLDAFDGSTIQGVSPVTAWSDKSGNSKTVTFSGTVTYNSSTKSINTTNSPTTYFFANVNLKKSQVTYATVFIVYTWTGSGQSGTNQALWGQDIGGGWNRFQLLGFNTTPSFAYGLSYTPSSPNVTTVSALNTSNRLLYSATYAYQITNGTYVYVNGSLSSATVTEAVSPSETSTTNTYFGTIDTGYSGTVAFNEILIYTSNISTSNRQKVEGYLAWKWGLQSNLPSNHPYKLFPPSP